MAKTSPTVAHRAACNCFALRQAARHVTQIYDRHLAEVGLRATQYSVLVNLRALERASIVELAKAMGMDRTTLGRAIRPLQREGLLTMGSGADGRTRALSLTAAGGARLDDAVGKWRAAQSEFETAFGAGAAANLRATLAEVVART